jgi:hypothetical protein
MVSETPGRFDIHQANVASGGFRNKLAYIELSPLPIYASFAAQRK